MAKTELVKVTPKIKRLQAKVVAHQAQNAGILRTAFDQISSSVKALADLDTFGEKTLESEIQLFLDVAKRFEARIKTYQKLKSAALTFALQNLHKASRTLEEARGFKGYKVKALRDRDRVDAARLKQVQASVEHRTREAAFVLAELEQAVDPFPGFKMVSAAARKRHDEQRKSLVPQPPPAPPEDEATGKA